MTAEIILLLSRRDATAALADIDIPATLRLVEGEAIGSTAACLDMILRRLRMHRAELTAVIADLHARGASGHAQLSAIHADLSGQADEGLAQIDLLIRHAQVCNAAIEHGGVMG